MIGGIGLVACGVIAMLRSSLPGAFGPFSVWNVTAILTNVIYAAAVLVLAIGTSREASVVARRPLGVTSMAILAAWPLVDVVAFPFLPQDGSSLGEWHTYGYVTLLVQTSAALVAAMHIARAGVLTAPWCWAPLWVLAFQALVFAVLQIAGVTAGAAELQYLVGLYLLLSSIAGLAGTLGLGILALVLAAQQRPESVEVYRSA